VISHIGSFVSIRGGHVYPTLVRQLAKRPIRVFLQDGSNDLDNRWGTGRWPTIDGGGAEVPRVRLSVRVRGWGAHPQARGRAASDALRWLWRDYAK
jgi:enterochelin esterase family protein